MDTDLVADLDKVLAEKEKFLIHLALTITAGRKKEAARRLNISFRSFRYRYEKHFGKMILDAYQD